MILGICGSAFLLSILYIITQSLEDKDHAHGLSISHGSLCLLAIVGHSFTTFQPVSLKHYSDK